MSLAKRILRPAVSAALVAVAVAVSLTGCTQQFYGVTCNFNVQNAHQRHSNSVVMNAKATVTCSAVVNSAVLTIKMQRSAGGRWIDVPGTQRTTTYATMKMKTPYQFNTADVKCAPGSYRAAAKGSAKLAGNKSASATWQYGNAAPITCR